jgi:hypothetical protein
VNLLPKLLGFTRQFVPEHKLTGDYGLSKNYLPFLRLTMNLLLAFFLERVLCPRVGLPQGVTGPGLPIGDLPSPPPWG